MKKGIIMDAKDNVGVVIQDVACGDEVAFGPELAVTAQDDVEVPHKLALVDIKSGENIVKYGEVMGYATVDIPAGAHVHIHNVDSEKMMK